MSKRPLLLLGILHLLTHNSPAASRILSGNNSGSSANSAGYGYSSNAGSSFTAVHAFAILPKFQSRYGTVNSPFSSLHTSAVIHTTTSTGTRKRTHNRSLTRSTMLKESNKSNASHQKSGMTSMRPSHSNGNSHAGKPHTHTARSGTTSHAHRLSASNTIIHGNSSNGNSNSNSATVNSNSNIKIIKNTNNHTRKRVQMHLHRPVRILHQNSLSHNNNQNNNHRHHLDMHTGMSTRLGISSGLTFDDGDQLLVSAQKPLGILLEEREPGDNDNYNDYYNSLTSAGIDTIAGAGTDDDDLQWGCIVSQVIQGGAADRAGVREGDVLVAVQNANVANASFEEVMERIGNAPRIVNLRFWRKVR